MGFIFNLSGVTRLFVSVVRKCSGHSASVFINIKVIGCYKNR